ncbi:hypothetical protein EYF80_025456 [Liparis tanakae]|uniref:Uncharacterized protein n=1 Tax=Liparis tanakae TaxID=230148 RepID=A0A4Z2HF49_9TELE|nr:hypothetical protein EYF80_025456 [Liparis tanakae]
MSEMGKEDVWSSSVRSAEGWRALEEAEDGWTERRASARLVVSAVLVFVFLSRRSRALALATLVLEAVLTVLFSRCMLLKERRLCSPPAFLSASPVTLASRNAMTASVSFRSIAVSMLPTESLRSRPPLPLLMRGMSSAGTLALGFSIVKLPWRTRGFPDLSPSIDPPPFLSSDLFLRSVVPEDRRGAWDGEDVELCFRLLVISPSLMGSMSFDAGLSPGVIHRELGEGPALTIRQTRGVLVLLHAKHLHILMHLIFCISMVYVPLSLWSSAASPPAVSAPLPTTEVSLGLVGLPVASPVLTELRPILWSSDLCLRRTRAAVGAPAVTVAGIGAGTLPTELDHEGSAAAAGSGPTGSDAPHARSHEAVCCFQAFFEGVAAVGKT